MEDIENIKKEKVEEISEKVKENNEDNRNEIKTIVDVNDENFEQEVIEKSKKIPVVVDFWAVWCMPCLMLSPALEKFADSDYKGKFILAKLNVDENPVTSQRYGIRSIPSVKMFKDGKVVDEFIGAIPESAVMQWLSKNLD